MTILFANDCSTIWDNVYDDIYNRNLNDAGNSNNNSYINNRYFINTRNDKRGRYFVSNSGFSPQTVAKASTSCSVNYNVNCCGGSDNSNNSMSISGSGTSSGISCSKCSALALKDSKSKNVPLNCIKEFYDSKKIPVVWYDR